MTAEPGTVELTTQDLRAVAAFAAACAEPALGLFEAGRPDDSRPRKAIEAAWAFARGGERGKLLRDTAWAALKAAGATDDAAAGQAARAAMAAAGAAYLHPLAKATQVKHILGAAELAAGDDRTRGAEHIARAAATASPEVVDVLARYPAAPEGGGRVGELIRLLDTALRPEGTRHRPF
ncbi:putative immunity protein [Streptomyces sp. NPDC048590]|uniref:putative immunity protein n=1 Tax=Streptomyces sp. NPDC048590 TaxID=3365574 RepID=UPI003714A9C4